MGKFYDKCLKYSMDHEPPPNYYVGHAWRCILHVFPLFLILFVFFTFLAGSSCFLADRFFGTLHLILWGKWCTIPRLSLLDSAISGLFLSLPICLWLGIREYRGKNIRNELSQYDSIHQKIINEIKNKKYLWLPSQEEVQAGFVSFEEYEQRVLTCNEIKKHEIPLRFLSTSELPPEDRAAILGNASGTIPEKSPEKTPPEPEPLSALRQSLSETIVSPNDELR